MEVRITDLLASLRKEYGLEVHRKAMDLARRPSQISDEKLATLARDLRQRLVARKMIPAKEPEPTSAPAKVAADNRPSCFSGLVARICGKQS